LAQQNWTSYYRIAKNGVSGKGIVFQLLPQDHNGVRYNYKSDNKTFEGMRNSSPPNPPFNQLKKGQEVTVYFDPQHPEISLLGDPKSIFKDETIAVVIGGVVLPFLVLLFLFYGNRKITGKPR
jgi:hypothetical protein